MRFLVDAQLPPLLAAWLAARGHDAQHVVDAGLRDADDGVIWRYALEVGAVIVTKDEDFALRAAVAAESPRILWLRLGNTRNAALLACLDRNLALAGSALAAGERLVEIR